MNLRHLGSMMLAAPAVLLALAGPAPTHAAETTITDPLTGTTVATRRNGGELTPQGWKVTSKGTGIGQYLYYLLPVGVTSGVLTFEAMGFKFDKYPSNGGETEEREHMLGVFDQDEPHDPAADPIGFFIRFYDHKNIPGSFYPGSHRMRFDSPTFERQCDAKAPVIWSPTRCAVPECDGAYPSLTRQEEDALWQACCTAAPARRRAFEPSSKRRKRAPVSLPPATG